MFLDIYKINFTFCCSAHVLIPVDPIPEPYCLEVVIALSMNVVAPEEYPGAFQQNFGHLLQYL